MVIVTVLRTHAAATATEVLTAGRVGMEATFHFSGEWDGLGKTAVFEAGGVTKDVIVDPDGILVPHECMIAGADLRVGVYGYDESGEIVIPTIYALVGQVQRGADPSGDESYPPTPDVGEQAVAAASKALQAAEEAQSVAAGIQRRADAGEFDGADGKSAYEYAQDGGYTGTEADFAGKLSAEYVKTVNGVKPDENGNVNVAGGGGSGGGSVELDTTLSISGKAADAKAVGDALAELESQIPEGGTAGNTEIPFFNLAEMGLGAVTAGGFWASLATDTSEIRAALEKGLVKFALTYDYEGAELDVEITGGVLYADELGESYQIIQNGVLGDDSIMLSVMVQPDGIGVVANKLLNRVDETLSIEGVPADAKAVGDALAELKAQNGIMSSAAALLITILRNGKYISDQSANITALESAIAGSGGEVQPVVYTVKNTLTNVSTNNEAASITGGKTYTATLTANDGYAIDYIRVVMGGADITDSAYSDGVIYIASVTGNLEITVGASVVTSNDVMQIGNVLHITGGVTVTNVDGVLRIA